MKKQKCLNLGPKRLELCIFGLEFENNIVIFEIGTLEFVKFQNLAKKTTKMLKFGTKNVLFGYFWAGALENYCHI